MDRRPDIDEEDEQGNFKRLSNPNTVSGSVHERSDEKESFAKRLKTDGDPDSQAYKIRWPVRFPLLPEKKFKDTQINDGGNVESTMEFLPDFLTIVQGTGASKRIGRRLTITNIHIRASLSIAGGIATELANWKQPESFRVILVHDKQCNGALPVATDLLVTDTIESYRNVNNILRFEFLMDSMTDLPLVGCGFTHDGASYNIAQQGVQVTKTWNYKCWIPIEYSGTTGVLSERVQQNVFLCIVSRVGNSTFGDAMCRIRYIDI